jgi:hypothetical protein
MPHQRGYSSALVSSFRSADADAGVTRHSFAHVHLLQQIHELGDAHDVIGFVTPLHMGVGGGGGALQ